jgi:transcriptional regulator with XRE-family HTH domain
VILGKGDIAMKGIGEKIKKALQESNLTQTQLAKKLGIKQQAVSKWITGTNDITISTLQKLADAVKKPMSYFFEANQEKENNSKPLPNDPIPESLKSFISNTNKTQTDILDKLVSIEKILKDK